MPKISYEAARINAKLNQEQAAKELNIAVKTLISYEKGRTEPRVSTRKAMCKLYGIPEDALAD